MRVEVVVSGKRVEVSPTLRRHTTEKVERVAKFAGDVRRVEVDYAEINNPRVTDGQICEILVHLRGHLVKSHAAAPDRHAALDLAVDKVERQLRRLHSRRTKRRDSRRDGGTERAAQAARARGRGVVAEAVEPALDAPVPRPAPDTDHEPVIVKTKQFVVKPMGPEEAALQMDLLGHDFFLFTSAENGRAAVIYRRRDGHYGLIEAEH